MNEFNKRLTEVYEILRHLSEQEQEKIPQEVKNIIKENKDNSYLWKYDETKTLKEQNIRRETIVILSYLNTEYLLNGEQKKLMEEFHRMNLEKISQQLPQAKGIEDLFDNKEESLIENIEEENTNEKAMIVSKSIFLSKIMGKIKKMFAKKN